MKRASFRRLGVAGAGFLLSLVALEGGLRGYREWRRSEDPWRRLLRVVDDPSLRYELVPGHETTLRHPGRGVVAYRTDSRGCRDAVPFPDAAAAARVLVLGDSVAFGFGVEAERIFPQRLEDLLNEGRPPGRRIEVINASAIGWGPYNQHAWWKSRHEALRPDVALIAFCMNDVLDLAGAMSHDSLVNLGMLDPKTPLPFPEEAPPSRPPPRPREGAFARAKRWTWERTLAVPFLSARKEDLLRALGLSKPETKPPLLWDCVRDLADPSSRRWEWLRGWWDRFDGFAAETGVPLALVAFPLAWQLDPGSGMDAAGENLFAEAQRRGWAALDLLPGFRARSSEGLFIEDPVHLSEGGHEVTALALRSFLEGRGLVPPR